MSLLLDGALALHCLLADDLAYSMLMGAQINQPLFNSTGQWMAFGPWEQAHGECDVGALCRVYTGYTNASTLYTPPCQMHTVWYTYYV